MSRQFLGLGTKDGKVVRIRASEVTRQDLEQALQPLKDQVKQIEHILDGCT